MIDQRGIPTHQCVCGTDTFKVLVKFEEGEIVWWTLNGYCAECEAPVTVPCPIDGEEESLC
jgi:hypothetical protein